MIVVFSSQWWVLTVRGDGNRKSKFFSEIGMKKTSEVGIPTHICSIRAYMVIIVVFVNFSEFILFFPI
ncbi:unnamed protein product [Meloidogyne enterolobii]|uniref:Uncharacterized protein n=1 Tax=Meloidogyne enterolobii TaxID=390850 RepID=A0ACB1AMJ7_MELEN